MDQVVSAVRVPPAAIAGLIRDALAEMGLPAADAAKVAELMTEADLTGADAHGVFRLPQYVAACAPAGSIRGPPSRWRRPRRRPLWWTATTAWDTW